RTDRPEGMSDGMICMATALKLCLSGLPNMTRRTGAPEEDHPVGFTSAASQRKRKLEPAATFTLTVRKPWSGCSHVLARRTILQGDPPPGANEPLEESVTVESRPAVLTSSRR